MRKLKTEPDKKYDDTPAFRQWEGVLRSVSLAKGRVNDAVEDLARATEYHSRMEAEAAYWQGIVEAENGKES
jgi:hypothetical protein